MAKNKSGGVFRRITDFFKTFFHKRHRIDNSPTAQIKKKHKKASSTTGQTVGEYKSSRYDAIPPKLFGESQQRRHGNIHRDRKKKVNKLHISRDTKRKHKKAKKNI
jgi:hypothetical protein